jgi:preprotein translocase subunit SecA
VLIGTSSEAQARRVSQQLTKLEVVHRTLLAADHAAEADIIARGGRLFAVTVATQLAGRGTDIRLGGDPERIAASEGERLERCEERVRAEAAEVRRRGGLCVLGVERRAARRIEDQLRGRAGRAGDPGDARFFVSLEDDVVRSFSPDDSLKASEAPLRTGERTDAEARTRTEHAQRVAESVDAQSRQLRLRLFDVLDEQRRALDGLRTDIMAGRYAIPADRPVDFEVLGTARKRFDAVVRRIAERHDTLAGPRSRLFARKIYRALGIDLEVGELPDDLGAAIPAIQNTCARALEGQYARFVHAAEDAAVERAVAEARAAGGAARLDTAQVVAARSRARADAEAHVRRRGAMLVLREFRLRSILALDARWPAQLEELARLRDGFGLRAYGVRRPFEEMRRDAWSAFDAMLRSARDEALDGVFCSRVVDARELDEWERDVRRTRDRG